MRSCPEFSRLMLAIWITILPCSPAIAQQYVCDLSHMVFRKPNGEEKFSPPPNNAKSTILEIQEGKRIASYYPNGGPRNSEDGAEFSHVEKLSQDGENVVIKVFTKKTASANIRAMVMENNSKKDVKLLTEYVMNGANSIMVSTCR